MKRQFVFQDGWMAGWGDARLKDKKMGDGCKNLPVYSIVLKRISV